MSDSWRVRQATKISDAATAARLPVHRGPREQEVELKTQQVQTDIHGKGDLQPPLMNEVVLGTEEGWTLVRIKIQRRQDITDRTSKRGFVTQKHKEDLMVIFNCLEKGHKRTECKKPVTCLKCNKPGNFSYRCSQAINEVIKENKNLQPPTTL